MFFVTRALSLASLLCAAALFGFFYAWVTSTMWGLDGADPRISIAAMQAMNGSVRNAVFAVPFFGTAPILAVTGVAVWIAGAHASALRMAVAAGLAVASFLVTALIHVPMNEALALVAVPEDIDAARAIWAGYSPQWQTWNIIRTAISGGAVLAVGGALLRLPRKAT